MTDDEDPIEKLEEALEEAADEIAIRKNTTLIGKKGDMEIRATPEALQQMGEADGLDDMLEEMACALIAHKKMMDGEQLTPEDMAALDKCEIGQLDCDDRDDYDEEELDVAQPGSAPALEAGGREFKSRRLDHIPYWQIATFEIASLSIAIIIWWLFAKGGS